MVINLNLSKDKLLVIVGSFVQIFSKVKVFLVKRRRDIEDRLVYFLIGLWSIPKSRERELILEVVVYVLFSSVWRIVRHYSLMKKLCYVKVLLIEQIHYRVRVRPSVFL